MEQAVPDKYWSRQAGYLEVAGGEELRSTGTGKQKFPKTQVNISKSQ